MPRPPRVWSPGAIYHLIGRGNNRQTIFFREWDYRIYLRLIDDARKRFRCTLLAYTLMTNHVHLMVQSGDTVPISKFMQVIGTAYAMYVNKRYGRVGHLFQGRFHSVLVESDSQALELSRYLHLNPVRAGMAERPELYRWSSYRAYVGRVQDPLIDSSLILGMISPRPADQHDLYATFVSEGQKQGQTLSTKLPRVFALGSDPA